MYAGLYKGRFPIGAFDGVLNGNPNDARTAKGTDFAALLKNVMSRSGATYADVTNKTAANVFICPDAYQGSAKFSTMLGAFYNANHYTAHPHLMGNIDQWNSDINAWGMPPYKKSQVRNSSEIILIFDGVPDRIGQRRGILRGVRPRQLWPVLKPLPPSWQCPRGSAPRPELTG